MTRGRYAVLAVAGPFTALLLGGALGSLSWRTPTQVLRFPFVADVPVGLLVTFLALGLVSGAGAVVAVVTAWGGSTRARLAALLGVVLVSAAASVWNGLYVTAISDAIPVLEWLFVAAPVAVGTLVAPRHRSRLGALADGLVCAAPAMLLGAFAWTIYGIDAIWGAFTFSSVFAATGVVLASPAALLRRSARVATAASAGPER